MLGCGEGVESVLRLGGQEQASGNLFIPSREIRRGGEVAGMDFVQ